VIVTPPLPADIGMEGKNTALRCTCGQKLMARVCRHIDTASQPELEEQLMRGELNVACCPKCGKINYLEEPLVYSDSRRKITLKALPRSWRSHSARTEGSLRRVEGQWTRTFYGLDALVSFIAVGNVPRKYGDKVADQAQMVADIYHTIGESRCQCGDSFRVEREFLMHNPGQGSVDVVRTRCVGCGEERSFYFQIPYVFDDWERERVRVPIYVKA
jgi:hypothetical protein